MAPRLRKQGSVNEKSKKDDSPEDKVDAAENLSRSEDVPLHGGLKKKVFTRILLSGAIIFLVYWTSKKEESDITFASQKDYLQIRSHEVPCSKEYKREMKKFSGCMPQRCGRLVTDIIVAEEEALQLLQIAKKGLALGGGSDGGASILDLHSGAVSKGTSFINIYQLIKSFGKNEIFTQKDFTVYRNVRRKIQQMIAYNFGVEVKKIYLTHPTFFSEMTSVPAKTVHDEYWHVHIDKETYSSFHYTSLLYLTNYGLDFTGGRFVFVDQKMNMTVEPRLGRVSAFTSGAENPHYVEKVTSGTRYALTVSFTCDKSFAIEDPSLTKLK